MPCVPVLTPAPKEQTAEGGKCLKFIFGLRDSPLSSWVCGRLTEVPVVSQERAP